MIFRKHTYQIQEPLGIYSGNVRAVISDSYVNNAMPDYYADYYPGGMVMPGRTGGSESNYRFGYQGQFAEKDYETGYNQFEARLYDARIGRWMIPDPAGQYWSPYVGMGNSWVNGVDPDGMEWEDRFEYKINDNADYELYRVVPEEGPHYSVLVDESGNFISDFFLFVDQSTVYKDYYSGALQYLVTDFGRGSIKYEHAMIESGVTDPKNQNFKWRYALFNSPQKHKMDYATKYLKNNTIYINGRLAFNKGDYGNYMWGDGMHRLGFKWVFLPLYGAQVINQKIGCGKNLEQNLQLENLIMVELLFMIVILINYQFLWDLKDGMENN